MLHCYTSLVSVSFSFWQIEHIAKEIFVYILRGLVITLLLKPHIHLGEWHRNGNSTLNMTAGLAWQVLHEFWRPITKLTANIVYINCTNRQQQPTVTISTSAHWLRMWNKLYVHYVCVLCGKHNINVQKKNSMRPLYMVITVFWLCTHHFGLDIVWRMLFGPLNVASSTLN